MPNPAEDYFMIQGDLDIYDLDIIDINGTTIQSLSGINYEERIDISGLGPGMYFIRMLHKENNILQVELMLKAQ